MIRTKRRRIDEEENLVHKKVKTFHPGPWRMTTLIEFPTGAERKRDNARKKNLEKSLEYNNKYRKVLKTSEKDELCDLLQNARIAPVRTSAVDAKLRDVLDSIIGSSRNQNTQSQVKQHHPDARTT